jgi:hypothetical protein
MPMTSECSSVISDRGERAAGPRAVWVILGVIASRSGLAWVLLSCVVRCWRAGASMSAVQWGCVGRAWGPALACLIIYTAPIDVCVSCPSTKLLFLLA